MQIINFLTSSSSQQSLLSSVHLFQNPGFPLRRNRRRRAKAYVMAGDGVERRVHVPERGPGQQGLLLPVLGHPRIGSFPQLRHRRRHIGVVFVHVDRRSHLPDHLARVLHVLLVGRGQRRRRREQGPRRSENRGRQGQELPAAGLLRGGGDGGGNGGGCGG